MASSMYEIIDLGDGEVGLARVGDEGEPIIRIKFSSESIHFLREARFDVAKAMLEAGMEMVSEITEEELEDISEFDDELDDESGFPILH